MTDDPTPKAARVPDPLGGELLIAEMLLALALAELPEGRMLAVLDEATARRSLALLPLDLTLLQLRDEL